MRSVDLQEEIQLRFKISSSECGAVIQVINYGYCTSDKNCSGAVFDLKADLKMERVYLTRRKIHS